MRVGLYTWGSEGDVRPFVALACGLARAGHDVRLGYVAIDRRDWSSACAPFGIASRSIAAETILRAGTSDGPHLDALVGKGNAMTQVEHVLAGLLDPAVEEMWTDASSTMDGCDVVVAHLLHHPALTAALARKIPVVAVQPAPVTPTRHIPPMGAPDLGPLNALTWRLADRIAGRWFLPRVNALRVRAGIAPLRSMFPKDNRDIALALTCVSPTLVPRPSDWESNHHVTGFFDLPDAAHPFEQPAELRAFLADPEAPVLMTFGSMLAMANEETTFCVRTMIEAAELANVRAIIQAPWDELPELPRSARVLRLGRAPHAMLLRSCRAMVHHGGAGTTQAACLAGRPSVVVPFLGDQFFWASRLRALGVAPASVPRKRLDASSLARRMRALLDDPGAAAKAQAIATAMRGEDGVARAVELIERVRA